VPQNPTVVLDRDDLRRTLVRIAHEIVEKNPPERAAESTEVSAPPTPPFAIVGIHRRGAVLAQRIHALVTKLVDTEIPLGSVDISFYRDDLGLRHGGLAAPVVHSTQLDFPVENRRIVIIDDVLYTGRTVRAAIDVIFDYGRPAQVQLAALVDRGHRELPIRPDFVGKNLPTARGQRVNVRVEEIDGYDEVAIVAVNPVNVDGPLTADPAPR
jgi:pyrimidine operon attenuation protein/uracil phosphoribosyltransferase